MDSMAALLCAIAPINVFLDTPMAKAFGAFVLAYVVYLFGRSAYFGQREAEQGRERYLDRGVDLVGGQIDYALGVHRHNWTLFLRYLKLYRESPIPFDVSDFFHQFIELDQSYFQIAPAHRLQGLIKDDIVWAGYQKVFSFVGTRNDLMKGDFGLALREHAAAVDHPKKADFLAAGEKVAKEMSAMSDKLYVFLSRLMELAAVTEQTRLTRRKIKSFNQRPDVRDILLRMRAACR